MRLVTFAGPDGDRPGVLHAGRVVDIGAVATSVLEHVQEPRITHDELSSYVRGGVATSTPWEQVTLRAPIPRPHRNIFCLGKNYADHVAETTAPDSLRDEVPDLPIWFTKATTSICGPADDLVLDFDLSDAYDWEVELAVVIGRPGHSIPASQALDHVYGYTVINDVSARDVQMRHGGQWFKGKSLDRSSPLGPWIVTADEVEDPHDLTVRCEVNGRTMQSASTAAMIFDIPTAIADISEAVTLEAGDIIATGTPAGVGAGQHPPVYLRDGDVVVTEVLGLGSLRNTVRALSPAERA